MKALRPTLALLVTAALAAGGFLAPAVEARAVSILAAPAGGEFAAGEVRVEKDRAAQSLTVRFDRPADAPPGAYSLWVETGLASGAFLPAGTFGAGTTRGGFTTWRLVLAGQGGPPEGLGITDLDDLSGRVVEVRDGGGAVVFLTGAVPLDRAAHRPAPTGAAPGRADLLRPEATPRPRARGQLLLEGNGGAGWLGLEARNLAAGMFPDPGLLSAAIETAPGSGILVPAGALSPVYAGNPWKGSFRLVWRVDLAADPDPLAGRRIEVHDGEGRPLLWANLPAVGAGEGARPIRAASPLAPPPASPSPEARGTVGLRHDPRLGRSGFSLEARGLGGGADLALWLSSSAGSGVLEFAGPLAVRRTAVRHRCRSERGDPLPLGAADTRALAGRAVEIRDGAGRVLLSGVLPLLAGPVAR
ncbi:MAG: hypothetical protein MUE73_03175 [Planctomycetes bacterium]|jgi:hypothetical protein|nr:hypothetical protein [Planctomycetota bacterium]